MTVTCNPDGSITIEANANEAASLAGRQNFGGVEPTQHELETKIADAWYEAGCPRES